MNATKKPNKKQAFSKIFLLNPYFKEYKLAIFLVFLALIVTSVAILFLGKIVKYLIDFGFAQSHEASLNLVLLKFFCAILILAIAGYFRSSLINEISEKSVTKLRQDIYKNLVFISSQFFENNKIGDVISRLTTDITLVYSIMSTSLAFSLRNILLFFGGLIFLFISSTKLTLISLILLPLAVIPIIFLGKKVKNLSLESQKKISGIVAHLEESLNGIKTIQAYGSQQKEIAIFNHLNSLNLNLAIKRARIKALLIAFVIAIAFSFVGLVIWLGSYEVINNKMSAGSLSSFIFYAIICATSLVSLSQVSGQIQTASAALERIFELLKIQSPIVEATNPTKLSKEIFKNISLEFKDISFAYPTRPESIILDKFNLKIKSQEKLAIIGPSGSGKSTILELMIRFFECDKGKILINSQIDIKKLSLKDLRSLFSYISQDCFIFSGTVLENIAYSNKIDLKNKAEKILIKSKIEALIKANRAFDFINKLPNGLESFVGQKGVKLSGGEKQRIAILRAIINEAPILLMDEATSALDNKNEKLISDLITSLAKDKMVIYVAHRLSSISHVDRIIFIKDGKILEEGTHEELLKKESHYKNLLNTKI